MTGIENWEEGVTGGMDGGKTREPALEPEDLVRFFVSWAIAGGVEGLVALYEPDALLAGTGGQTLVGTEAIRGFYAELLAGRPRFEPGEHRPALHRGALALTGHVLWNDDHDALAEATGLAASKLRSAARNTPPA